MSNVVYAAWGAPTSLTGSMASTLGVINPFRYRGYVYDQETGLYYLRSRYYNPAWGRFINPDIVVGTEGQPFDHNLYSYCGNNPSNNADPEGLWFWDAVKKVAEAVVVTAIVVAVVAATVFVASAIVAGTGGTGLLAFVGGSAVGGAEAVAIASAAAHTFVNATATTLAAGIVYCAAKHGDEGDYYRSKSPQGKNNRTPRSNTAQNKQFDDAVKALKRQGIELTPAQQQELHREIYHLGYGYQDILDTALSMFGGK